MDHQEAFDQLTQHVRKTKMLGSINELLEWDQQTMMPPTGAAYRSEQAKWLAGEIHQRETDPRIGEWLQLLQTSDLATEPDSDTGSTIRELFHQYEKKRKLPLDLVQHQAMLHSRGQQIWIKARQENDYASFAPTLKEIFQLKREEAQATYNSDCLYDALLDDYEPGAKTASVRQALEQLRDGLVPLIAVAKENQPRGNAAALAASNFPARQQKAFAELATSSIGFDYQRGRLDTAAHPFCSEMGPNDCRITTRYDEGNFSSAFFGCLHEAGHGLYEQGLRADMYGLPPGSYCSLGIHESQSRLWENLVGRSQGFWSHFLPIAQKHFPGCFENMSAVDMYWSVNRLRPSLIRVEADEITYNLHIIIRFELEQALLQQELSVDDLPTAWNQKYSDYLDITPQDDRDGVLQDIHWSAGLVGYFPTYSLGNIFASMLFQTANSELGCQETHFAEGRFTDLLNWLQSNVYRRGNQLRSDNLMKEVTGSSIDHSPLIEHLTHKTQAVYSPIN